MRTLTKLTAATLGLVLLLTGCASSTPKSTAFVPNPEVLKVSPNDENTLYSLNKKIDLGSYNTIIVKPVEIIENKKEDKLDSKLAKNISTYFQDKLSKDFNKVVKNDKMAKNDLELLVFIDSIDVSYDNLKFYQYLPFGLAISAIKKGTGFESRKLRVSLSIKLIDKQTSQTIAIIIDRKVGKDVDNKEVLTFNDIKPLLDNWSTRFAKRLAVVRKVSGT